MIETDEKDLGVRDVGGLTTVVSGSDPGRFVRILGCRVDVVTFRETLSKVRKFLHTDNVHQIVTANTLMLLAAEKDTELKSILEKAALVVPESAGIRWAAWYKRLALQEFIPGIDLLQVLCALARDEKSSVFLLGAKPGVAEQAGQSLVTRFPGLHIAGTQHGYFSPAEEVAVMQKIRNASPAFLFVGMSVPGQEKWIAKNLQALGVPVVMGVGGSFDVLSGRLRRAPMWMRRAGVEWLYRLMQEPWRWKRIAQLPVFMWKVLREHQDRSKSKNVTADSR